MNVLLIYPEFPVTFWSFQHALQFIRKRAMMPPLGLLTVAAMLPREWNLRLVDMNIQRLTAADLRWADCAMISAMTVQRSSTAATIARCKSAGLKVIAGGPLFSAEHEQFAGVDHFVLNEAELTLPPFLADFALGKARRIYSTTEMADLHRSPTPRWELAKLAHYGSMGLQYSRGCPFDCEFCNVTSLFGRKPRTKTAQQMIAELDGLRRLGWREQVFFVDDNLIGNRKRVREELLPALKTWQKRGPALPLMTQVSINLADDEAMTREMAAVGFDAVFVGIETPASEGLAECSKQQNQGRDLVADVKRLQRAGLQVQAGFIVGFDSDGPTIFQRQIDFIQKSGIVTAMVGLLQAIPGTRLYERLKQNGRLLGRMTGDNADGTTNIIPVMPAADLHAGYQKILRAIYSPRRFYRRVNTFLREYHLPHIRLSLSRERIAALGRSMLRLGVLGRERFQYWKLLLRTLICRPRMVPMAVEMAICGYHFRRIFEMQGRGET